MSNVEEAFLYPHAKIAFNLINSTDMALLGSHGNTAQEIQNFLSNGIEAESIHEYLSQLFYEIKSCSIKAANTAFCSESLKTLDSYKLQLKQHYSTLIETVDFGENTETAFKINEFIKDATDNEIQNLIDPSILNERVRFVIVNAILFNKKWTTPFQMISENSCFYSYSDKTIKVPMMTKYGNFPYYEDSDFKMLELKYDDEKYSLFVVLPQERFGLSTVLSRIDTKKMLHLMSAMQLGEGSVTLPTINIRSSYILKKLLNGYGIWEAFDKTKADFSKISNDAELYIDEIYHKTYIQIDAEGTKSAAATAAVFYEMSGSLNLFNFKADHPFLFIVAKNAKNILFLGTFFN